MRKKELLNYHKIKYDQEKITMAKDYSKLEKDDLLKVIEKLESRKKYGLIWDKKKTKE